VPGEVLVGVPPIGSLLDLHAQLDPIFGGLLLRGRGAGTSDTVEWILDGHELVGADHAAADAARDALWRRCVDAMELADELRQALARVSREAATVDLPADLARRLGGRPTGERSTQSVGNVRAIRDALPKAVAAIERAINRGNFAVRGGQARLFGWCFLQPDAEPWRPPVKPGVELGHALEGAGVPGARHRFKWRVTGGGESVWLARCDDATHHPVEGSDRLLPDPDTQGVWRFDPSAIPAGIYRAFVRWWGGLAESNAVHIEGSAVPPPFDPVPMPLSVTPASPIAVPQLRLEYRELPAASGLEQRLDWSCDGDLDTVELFRVDGGRIERVAGPDALLISQRQGGWSFTPAPLPAGAEYEAHGRISGEEVKSNRIRIPDRPVQPAGGCSEWCRNLWKWWALWGLCAWCSRLGCPPGCVGRVLRALLVIGALVLLSLLLRGCFPSWGIWRVFGDGDGVHVGGGSGTGTVIPSGTGTETIVTPGDPRIPLPPLQPGVITEPGVVVKPGGSGAVTQPPVQPVRPPTNQPPPRQRPPNGNIWKP
jgi:hypothetical protein